MSTPDELWIDLHQDEDMLEYAIRKTAAAIREKDTLRRYELPKTAQPGVNLEIELNRVRWALNELKLQQEAFREELDQLARSTRVL